MTIGDVARIAELEAQVASLERALNYDELTGAFTRQYLRSRTAEAMDGVQYLLFVDIDDFKSVNDHYGHLAGDRLLTQIARVMMDAVGDDGFVVRLAGDEFVILLGDLPDAQRSDMIDGIVAKIATATIKVGDLEVARTASLGYIALAPDDDLQKALEKKIQTATFVISNPLPTIELNVVKKIAKPYHVVAGAFQFSENAQIKVDQLKAQGYNAKIIGVNKWGLTQVAFNSYSDKNEATNNLYKIQKTVSKDAWLLIEKVD